MAKTKRDEIKRKIAQSYINLQWAGQYISEVHEMFEQTHKTEAGRLSFIACGIGAVMEVINQFMSDVYQLDNPNWTSLAATGRPTHKIVLDYPGNEDLELKPIPDNDNVE